MGAKVVSHIYNDYQVESKMKQHRDNLAAVRDLIGKVRETLDNENFVGLDELYQLAKDTDWINQVDFNLKTFVGCYLTESEKELFNIVYHHWMFRAVEYTIGQEEGISDE